MAVYRHWRRRKTDHDRPTYVHHPTRVLLQLFPDNLWICINPHAPPAARDRVTFHRRPHQALEHAAAGPLQYDHGFHFVEAARNEATP